MSKLNAASKGLGDHLPSAHCDFCDELAGGTDNAFYARYHGTPASRQLLTTDNFRVFPSIGQLLEGYLLIAPLSHYRAVDEVPEKLIAEFAALSRYVRIVLQKIYGSCVCFEHGARQQQNGGCGIYHAHLHAVPIGGRSDPVEILKKTFPYTGLIDPGELNQLTLGLPSYLFYQDSQGRPYLFDAGRLPSQYMRKLLADAIGVQGWDWRKAGREERLLATLQRLSGQFDSAQRSSHMHIL